jgi:hypothetical protein
MFFNLSTLYGGPIIENRHFFDYPAEIIQYNTTSLISDTISRTDIRYEKIANDLYLLYENAPGYYISKTLCLNVSINKNKELLLLQLFNLVNFDDDGIEYFENRIEIKRASIYYYNQINENVKLVFNFNDDNLLNNTILFDNNKNEIIENYSYFYDSNKRLVNITVELIDSTKLTRKSLFYDGVFRDIPKPYFYDLVVPNIDEILIFNNDSVKYHLKITGRSRDRYTYERNTLEKNDEWYYILFEYNQNGDEIKQGKYYDNGAEIIYFANYIEYDNHNNWTKKIFTDADGYNIAGEVIREFQYKN